MMAFTFLRMQWTERSYDALETLDKIWRAVRDIQ